MSRPRALNKCCMVRVLEGQPLIVVENAFGVKEFLKNQLEAVCPEGSVEPLLRHVITKKSWVVATDSAQQTHAAAKSIINFCKNGGDSGVIPIKAKVVRTALVNDQVVSALLMTTEAMATDLPEEKAPAPPMGGGRTGGGMGGMRGMPGIM